MKKVVAEEYKHSKGTVKVRGDDDPMIKIQKGLMGYFTPIGGGNDNGRANCRLSIPCIPGGTLSISQVYFSRQVTLQKFLMRVQLFIILEMLMKKI